ncbi:MAG TPA: hypothetical protein VEF06_07525 [Bryobacteraceae bacterium]|nr:hypothetical protein [Bryobacteraceae bacterium]
MVRQAVFFLLFGMALSAQTPPTGSLDPAFRNIPFESWFSGEQAHIRWAAETAEPALSPHLRLRSAVKLKIDGRDLATRRGKGQMGMLIQIRDNHGGIWQTHEGILLSSLQESVVANDIEYTQPFFALPGDYEISLAIVDTATREHATIRRKLHVPAAKNEPPDAWRDLPAIQFIHSNQPPDAWFIPDVKDTLRLMARPQHPSTIDILVNLTPTERLSGSNRSQDRNLSLLVPAMKVLAGADWGDTPVRVSFLDLSNRKVTFDQEQVKTVDWEKAKASLAEMAPGIIDVKSLENRRFSANFFVQQVGKRIDRTGSDPQRIVIVLSSPTAFEAGVERHQIEAEASGDAHVFYVRYHPYVSQVSIAPPPRPDLGRRDRFGDVVFHPAPPGAQDDQLAPLLKPIRPEVFDVLNPEQFRKTVATILDEVSRL